MDIDKFAIVQEQNRLRAKRFYDANKVRILNQKKASRDATKVVIPKIEIPEIKNPYDEESIINRIELLPMNPNTKRKKISSVKVIFNIFPSNNLMESLNRYETMKNRLEDAHQIKNPEIKYSPETLKVIGQCILWVVRNLGIPMKSDVFAKYQNLVNVFKLKAIEHKDNQKNDIQNAVLPYSVYLEKIKSHFGIDSIQYLIASIYNEITCRDDIASLVIISKKGDAIDLNTNYLVLPKKINGTIILQHYKTAVLYRKQSFPLTNTLSNLIRSYVSSHKLSDKLFPNNFNNGLTNLISIMNKKINVDGSINTIRKMKITDFLKNPNLSIEDKVKFANSCLHSPTSQNYYNYVQSVKE